MNTKKQAIIILLEIFSFFTFLAAIFVLLYFSSFEWTISAGILILTIYLLNLFLCINVFLQKRINESKLAWFFLFVLLPIIGHTIFMCFGNIKKYKTLSYDEYYQIKQKRFNGEIKIQNSDNFLNSIQKITNANYFFSNIEFYYKGWEAYNKIFEDMKNAKKYIFIQMYILKPSENYQFFKNLIFKKAKEGVEIKMIIDDFGKWSLSNREIESFKNKANIEIFEYSKIKFPFVSGSQAFRLHRKFVLIDGEVIHSGGLNISDEYSSFNEKYGYWADLNYRDDSSLVANEYLKLFIFDWENWTKKKIDYQKHVSFKETDKFNSKIIFSEGGPNIDENIIEKILFKAILFASKSIDIITPYFIPEIKTFEAIRTALLSGVKIRIFIPGKPDKKSVYRVTNYYLNQLMKDFDNVEVYSLNNIFLHSKYMVVDNKYSFFGSYNFDMRSFFQNYELLNISSSEFISTYLNSLSKEYKEISIKKHYKKYSLAKLFFIKVFTITWAPLL